MVKMERHFIKRLSNGTSLFVYSTSSCIGRDASQMRCNR